MNEIKDIIGFVIEVTAWLVAIIVAIAAFGFFVETKAEYDLIKSPKIKTVTPVESSDFMYELYTRSLEKGENK